MITWCGGYTEVSTLNFRSQMCWILMQKKGPKMSFKILQKNSTIWRKWSFYWDLCVIGWLLKQLNRAHVHTMYQCDNSRSAINCWTLLPNEQATPLKSNIILKMWDLCTEMDRWMDGWIIIKTSGLSFQAAVSTVQKQVDFTHNRVNKAQTI